MKEKLFEFYFIALFVHLRSRNKATVLVQRLTQKAFFYSMRMFLYSFLAVSFAFKIIKYIKFVLLKLYDGYLVVPQRLQYHDCWINRKQEFTVFLISISVAINKAILPFPASFQIISQSKRILGYWLEQEAA